MRQRFFDDLQVRARPDCGGSLSQETRLGGLMVVLLALIGLTTADSQTTGSVSDVMSNAIGEREGLPAAVGSLWRFEGPRAQGGGRLAEDVTDKGVTSGRINEIAVLPGSPQVIYASGATGGLWKTTDGGITWAPRSKGWLIQSATAVAIDPNNTSRIFVGTGDYKRMDHVEPFSVGIMKSVDGGLNWTKVGGAAMEALTVSRIVIDPTNFLNMLATTGRGGQMPAGRIFRSTKGGNTWAPITQDSVGDPIPDANWDDLEVDAGHIFWASATRRHSLVVGSPLQCGNADPTADSGLLYQSLDGGATWSKVHLQVPGVFDLDAASVRADTIQIAVRPGSSSVFVAVFQGGGARVFRTTDVGASWSEIVPAAPLAVGACAWGHAAFGATANFLYVGGTSMFRGQLGTGTSITYTGLSGTFHEDFQCVAPDPLETDAVFLGTDGGVYRFPAFGSPPTNSLSSTLGVTQVYRMDVHPRHGGLIAIGSQDLGNSVSFAENGNDAAALLQPPNWAVIQTGDGRSAAFREDTTSRVYVSNTDGRVRRYDGLNLPINLQGTGGLNTAGAPLLFQNDLLSYADTQFAQLSNPESKMCLVDYCSGAGSTADWSISDFTGGVPLPGTDVIQSLGLCSSDKKVTYAASTNGEIFLLDDGATNWVKLDDAGLPGNFPLWAISPSPTNCHSVLVGVGYDKVGVTTGSNALLAGARLFRRTDVLAGGKWTSVHGSTAPLPHAPVFAIARSPSAPDSKWFVASDVGVFRTDDGDGLGGPHWANATAPLGLPNTLVRDLRLSADGNTLYAGTFGRGVWSMDVNPPANYFGVRGTLTQGGKPIQGASAVAIGAGRILQFLKNTITTGKIVTTAPIAVTQFATISQATASLSVTNAGSVSLVAPDGSVIPMTFASTSGGVSQYALTSSSAAPLVGRGSKGNWSFNVSGAVAKSGVRLTPSVFSGFVSLDFTDKLVALTGPDGEYTLEYLTRGVHNVGIFDCCSQNVDIQSNRTGVDFQPPVVGVFVLNPRIGHAKAGEKLIYTLAYTITEGRPWRDLTTVQLRFRDDRGTILWVAFNSAAGTFSLVDPATGAVGPGFAPGSRKKLRTVAASLDLSAAVVSPNVPDTSSVTLTLGLTFKTPAADRSYQVEVLAKDVLGTTQGPEFAGNLEVIK